MYTTIPKPAYGLEPGTKKHFLRQTPYLPFRICNGFVATIPFVKQSTLAVNKTKDANQFSKYTTHNTILSILNILKMKIA